MRLPATPGWGPPAAALAVSVGLVAGFPVLCVFVARRVRVVSVLVCVLCVHGVCVGGCSGVGLSSACVCVCVCVPVWCVCRLWLLVLASPGWGLLPVLVWVWLVPRHSWRRFLSAIPRQSWLGSAGCGGVWSLATPGCGSWLRFPATPGWGGGSAGSGGGWPLATPG